jgi:hypothetical protein
MASFRFDPTSFVRQSSVGTSHRARLEESFHTSVKELEPLVARPYVLGRELAGKPPLHPRTLDHLWAQTALGRVNLERIARLELGARVEALIARDGGMVPSAGSIGFWNKASDLRVGHLGSKLRLKLAGERPTLAGEVNEAGWLKALDDFDKRLAGLPHQAPSGQDLPKENAVQAQSWISEPSRRPPRRVLTAGLESVTEPFESVLGPILDVFDPKV